MNLKDVSIDKFEKVLLSNKNLLNSFEDYVSNSEMDFINDKLSCFTFSSADWSIGPYGKIIFR